MGGVVPLLQYQMAIEKAFRDLRAGKTNLADAEAYLKKQNEENLDGLYEHCKIWLGEPAKAHEIGMPADKGIDWNQNAINAALCGADRTKASALHRVGAALLGYRLAEKIRQGNG